MTFCGFIPLLCLGYLQFFLRHCQKLVLEMGKNDGKSAQQNVPLFQIYCPHLGAPWGPKFVSYEYVECDFHICWTIGIPRCTKINESKVRQSGLNKYCCIQLEQMDLSLEEIVHLKWFWNLILLPSLKSIH